MYCSHCGKKVTDMMLFCPFCGEPIVIPDQDEGVGLPEPSARDEAEPGGGALCEPENDAPQGAPVSEPDKAEVDDAPAEAGAPDDSDNSAGAEAPPSPSDAAVELLNWDVDRRAYAEREPVDEDADTSFSPLPLDQEEPESEDWHSDIARRKQEAAPEKKPPETQRAENQAAHLDGRAPRLEENKGQDVQSHRTANTFVPPKAMDPNDLFMDAKQGDYDRYDDYDAYDADEDDYDDEDDDYVYEDEEQGSFFMRHIRGIVGATLFLVLALLFVIYLCSNSGQVALAKANLAWKVDVYSALGYQSFQDQRYDEAGLYYERALARDPDNYSYASSAAMAYFTGNNTEKAASMLKKCAEISPQNVEPYVYLLNLYPEASKRPWDITQLIQKGYEITGDSRLASIH